MHHSSQNYIISRRKVKTLLRASLKRAPGFSNEESDRTPHRFILTRSGGTDSQVGRAAMMWPGRCVVFYRLTAKGRGRGCNDKSPAQHDDALQSDTESKKKQKKEAKRWRITIHLASRLEGRHRTGRRASSLPTF